MNKPKIQGHRGASALEPENTMRAFTRAFDDGADGIEFDIRLTADKELVVIHDNTINRTSNGTGLVKNYSYNELLQFNFGRGEKIPLLRDVLQKFGEKYWLNIEIKEIGIEEQLVKILHELNVKEKIIISSFELTALKKVVSIDSSLSTAYIYNTISPNLSLIKKLNKIDAIHPRKNLVTRNLVLKANAIGLPIRTWTVDKPKVAMKIAKLNIDTIITNNPKAIIQALE